MDRRAYPFAIVATLFAFASLSASGPAPARGAAARDLILATTTSFQDSGLLDVLVRGFEAATGLHVKPIAVGSGEAIRMGEQGSADVLVVHSPADEEKLMAAGFGLDRKELMTNDFVLVGPPADPAGVRGRRMAEALAAVRAGGHVFVSRADASGTDKKEKGLWKKAGLEAKGAWYLETGQGMGETLRIASEKGGYALTDRGTYLALKDRLGLAVLVEGEPDLLNVYHVITLNPDKNPGIDLEGAVAFMDYLLSPGTQRIIGEFGRDKYGVSLFKPALKGNEE